MSALRGRKMFQYNPNQLNNSMLGLHGPNFETFLHTWVMRRIISFTLFLFDLTLLYYYIVFWAFLFVLLVLVYRFRFSSVTFSISRFVVYNRKLLFFFKFWPTPLFLLHLFFLSKIWDTYYHSSYSEPHRCFFMFIRIN